MLVHPTVFLNQVYIISSLSHHPKCAAIANLTATVWLTAPVPKVGKEIDTWSHRLGIIIDFSRRNRLIVTKENPMAISV